MFRILAFAMALLFAPLIQWSAALAAASEEEGEKVLPRLAIIIGNSDYQSDHLIDLQNSRNDAGKLSEALEALHFEVITLKDATFTEIDRTMTGIESRLDQYSAVVFYYAGHGVQINGTNYLLPVDTPDPENADKLVSRAIKLDDLIGKLADRARPTLIFLDACRNNPLPKGAEPVNDGLAQVEVGDNTYIAFATKPGGVTYDGKDENSPFTKAMLASIQIPGRSIAEMMLQVRKDTEALTFQRQTPWEQSNLLEQFYFTAQQQIEPALLSEELGRILQSPEAKQMLMARLEAQESLQTIVLELSQGGVKRSVEMGAAGDAPKQPGLTIGSAPATGGVAVTSNDYRQVNYGAEGQSAPNASLATLMSEIFKERGESTDDRKKQTELARSVQTELRRLGCYRNKIDGDWGSGSVRALSEYYRRTKQSYDNTDPNIDLLSKLYLRSGRICPEPVVPREKNQVRKEKGSPEKGVAQQKGKGGGKAVAQRAKSGGAPKKAEAPPPDIRSAIGIGGIF